MTFTLAGCVALTLALTGLMNNNEPWCQYDTPTPTNISIANALLAYAPTSLGVSCC